MFKRVFKADMTEQQINMQKKARQIDFLYYSMKLTKRAENTNIV